MPDSAIVRGAGPRDGFPDYIVRTVSRDQIGVLRGITVRHFKVGAVNQRVDPNWLNRFTAPDPGWGIPCVNCDGEIRDAMCVVTCNYEGSEENYAFNADDEITYEFETTSANEGIETHPLFGRYKDIYGWDEDRRQFAEFIPASSVGGGKSALSTDKDGSVRSPLAGVDQWFHFGGVFIKTYAARTVPASVYKGIGTVIKRPEGVEQLNLPDSTLDNRFWLKLAPRIRKRGSAVQITEQAQLGKPGGQRAAKILYSFAQLTGTA